MSSRSTGRVRFWVAALGLTLVAAVAAPGAVAASGPPATTPPVATWTHNPASEIGPQFWSSLDPACGKPDGQSPIVVKSATVDKKLPPLRANYARTPLLVENTGHVVEVPQPGDDGGILAIGTATEDPYYLRQWHIHAPAEHVVDGHRADLEIHLVHSDLQGRTVVLAVFADIVAGQHGKGSVAAARLLHTVLRGAPDTAGEEADLHQKTSAAVLLGTGPAVFGDNKVTIDKYLTYTGSLTTPPCTGGVSWYLLPQTVITVDPKDVDQLHELIADFPGYDGYPDNRPVQPLAGRTVTSTKGW